MNKVLVVYASKHGSTGEIAERIAETLRQAGLETAALPVEQAGDVAQYSAVVLGSAVYAGQWVKEAAEFLKQQEAKLAARPVWIFSSGPTGEGEPVTLLKGWRLPESLQAFVQRIGPRDIAVFHGEIDTQTLNFAERLIIRGVKAPTGDFRDWKAIENWAAAIAAALRQESGQAQP